MWGQAFNRALPLIALAFVAFAGSSKAEPQVRMKCEFYRSQACSPSECYDVTKAAGWSVIDWATNTYHSCDNQGCKESKFDRYADGVYLRFNFPDTDMWFKLNLTDQSAMEVTSILNTVIVAFGNCRAAHADE